MQTLHPKPDAPLVVRKLPEARTALAMPMTVARAEDSLLVTTVVKVPQPVRALPPRVATPLAPERYRIQLTVSRETHDKFRRAQALLRHAVPSGDAAQIFDRAITLLVERIETQKAALVARPTTQGETDGTARRIPAAVRRQVWKRDAGRCAFVGEHGRCRETAFLEFHHVQPFAAAGRATVGNIALRCRAHNGFEASLVFATGGADVVREARSAFA